ncbi:MAG TPA: WD40 repeat domain-containing protein [Spirochaetota bacterium]|nr:WD40 repeat domain-containing protein [Spirochaetota bacterium]HPU87711.1 WD40 repeat domain-containing protein [Spirochaetota bacterium]
MKRIIQSLICLAVLGTVAADAQAPAPEVRKPVKTSKPGAVGTALVVFSNDGKYIATAPDGDGVFRLWDAKTLSVKKALGDVKNVLKYAIAFSPDSSLVAAGVGDEIHVWETATYTLVKKFTAHKNARIQSLGFTPDGRFLVSAGSDTDPGKRGCVWSTDTWSLKHHLGYDYGHLWLRSASISPDGRFVVVGGGSDASKDHHALVYDIRSGQKVRELAVFIKANDKFQDGMINNVAYSPSGGQIAVITQSRILGFDAESGEQQFRINKSFHISFQYLRYSPDGKYCAALHKAGRDYCVHIIDARSGSIVRTFVASAGDKRYYYNLAFTHDGKLLALVGTKATIDFYEWR